MIHMALENLQGISLSAIYIYLYAYPSLMFQVLKFNAYFKQTVHESQNEYYRVRPVDIYYYLEDDSIAVIEPHVENSGMPQGQCLHCA